MDERAEEAGGAAEGRGSDRGQPWWSLRISAGITARVWFPLLARHRFRVSPSRLHAAIAATLISLVVSVPAAIQRWRLAGRIAAEPIPPPVFIVGHWRSGTTFLHELLATDRRFLTPTYLHTFATDHFLVWEKTLRRLGGLMPAHRPMDEVAVGWDRPQEDEFALLAMGAPSPYEAMLFPNDRQKLSGRLDIESMPPAAGLAWEAALTTTLRRIVFARRRTSPGEPAAWCLLKSPTHTARIGLLRRMFPEARFIHVVRDPLALYPSSEHLWRRMFESQGMQHPRYDGAPLDRFVNETARALYRNFDRDIGALPAGSFVETRYEDLIRDPAGETARIRETLNLPPADAEALDRHLAEVGSYRRNRFAPDRATLQMIRREWRWYADRFGYWDGATG